MFPAERPRLDPPTRPRSSRHSGGSGRAARVARVSTGARGVWTRGARPPPSPACGPRGSRRCEGPDNASASLGCGDSEAKAGTGPRCRRRRRRVHRPRPGQEWTRGSRLVARLLSPSPPRPRAVGSPPGTPPPPPSPPLREATDPAIPLPRSETTNKYSGADAGP